MPRATNNPASRHRRKKILKAARGNVGGRGRLLKSAKETVEKGLGYAYRDRRNKKREFRRLWIVRINAACRLNGMNYSRFIDGLSRKEITLDRKALADLAVRNPADFNLLVEAVR